MKKNPPIPALTGLRCIAALFVVVSHLLPLLVPNCPPLFFIALSGLGMQLFFVLSGFVIHYNYSGSIRSEGVKGIFNFFVARFARIYPLYMVCILIELLHLYGYSQLPEQVLHVLPYYLTLTQSWFYKLFNTNTLIYQFGLMSQVSWSISTECFFYLVYPVICILIQRLKSFRSHLIFALIVSIAALGFASFIGFFRTNLDSIFVEKYGAIAATGDVLEWNANSFNRWLIYFSPYSRVMEFVLGSLTAAIYLHLQHRKVSIKEKKLGWVALLTALFLLILSHKYLFYTSVDKNYAWVCLFHMSFGFAPMLAVIIFVVVKYPNFLSRLLASRILLKGGEISYSTYLLHMPIALAFSRDAASVEGVRVIVANIARSVLAIAAIFGAASIFYRYLEVPARQFIRNKLRWRSKIEKLVLTKSKS